MMRVVAFTHEGLGNSSYLVEVAEGVATLVDPDRSADRYLVAADRLGWHINAVFETHVHADFVSGAVEIVEAHGATVFAPKGADVPYQQQTVEGGQRVRLHDVEVDCIAAPGHTPEHLAYVFRQGDQAVLFSGGALIAGGAARTDLISPEMTETLSRAQFHTLQHAFDALPDETRLYPTHGGGSFCAATSGGKSASRLGWERSHNPLLAIKSEDEFMQAFPRTFPGAPDYFFRMRAFNQAGPRLRGDVPKPPPLNPVEFGEAASRSLVLDVRRAARYFEAHVPASVSIPFRAEYCVWLGWLVPPDSPLLFIAEAAELADVLDQSMLVGYERFAGWLESGVEGWIEAGQAVRHGAVVDPVEALAAAKTGLTYLDVREPSEYESGHIEGALNVPLGSLEGRAAEFGKDRRVLVYCGVGARSVTAQSLLERAGGEGVLNLNGGIRAWRKLGLPVVS